MLEIHTFKFYLLPLWYFYFCLNIRCWNPESDMSKILEKWDVLKAFINSLSKISNSLDSNQSIDLPIHTNRKCGTSFENTCKFDLGKARSGCASAQFNQCLGDPVAQWVKSWPIDGAVLGLSPARGGDLSNRKRGFMTHSFLLSPLLCPDLTEMCGVGYSARFWTFLNHLIFRYTESEHTIL